MRIVTIELSELILKGLEVFRKMSDCGLGQVDIGGGGGGDFVGAVIVAVAAGVV